MKIPKKLHNRSDVVIDTNIFIYLYEEDPAFVDVAEFIILEAENRSFSAVVTPITISEIIVKPLSLDQPDIADRCVNALRSYENIKCMSIDVEIARMAGALRAKYKYPLPDMYQVAIALRSATPTLITNDKRLKVITEVTVFILSDFE